MTTEITKACRNVAEKLEVVRSASELGPDQLAERHRDGPPPVGNARDDAQAAPAHLVMVPRWHGELRVVVADLEAQRIGVPCIHPSAVIGVENNVRHELTRDEAHALGQFAVAGEERFQRLPSCAGRPEVVAELEADVRGWTVGALFHEKDVPRSVSIRRER